MRLSCQKGPFTYIHVRTDLLYQTPYFIHIVRCTTVVLLSYVSTKYVYIRRRWNKQCNQRNEHIKLLLAQAGCPTSCQRQQPKRTLPQGHRRHSVVLDVVQQRPRRSNQLPLRLLIMVRFFVLLLLRRWSCLATLAPTRAGGSTPRRASTSMASAHFRGKCCSKTPTAM